MKGATITGVSVDELAEWFDNDATCEHIVLADVCGQPATWVWVFEVTCDHARMNNYLCTTHHVLANEDEVRRGTAGKPWRCRICGALAHIKEKRRIK